MSIVVCQEKNTYLHYFIFPLNFPGLLKSEGGQGNHRAKDPIMGLGGRGRRKRVVEDGHWRSFQH
jgi:hypothetical protein